MKMKDLKNLFVIAHLNADTGIGGWLVDDDGFYSETRNMPDASLFTESEVDHLKKSEFRQFPKWDAKNVTVYAARCQTMLLPC